jgi:hypothetical protein
LSLLLPIRAGRSPQRGYLSISTEFLLWSKFRREERCECPQSQPKTSCSVRTNTMSDQSLVNIMLAIVGAVALSAFALLVKKPPARRTDKPTNARENAFRFIVGWVLFGSGSIIVFSAGLTYFSGNDDPFNILFGAFGALNIVYGLSLLVVASRSRAS